MQIVGRRFLHFETVSSTSDIAWEHAGQDAYHGLVVTAEEQQQGRGTRGRRWHAERGTALLCSVLLRLEPQFSRPVVLTTWAGISVCKAIDQLSTMKPVLKWPNDILIDQRKICGILVEIRNNWSVVGIGINVNKPRQDLLELGIPNTAFVNETSKKLVSIDDLKEIILSELNASYDLVQNAQQDALLDDWARYSGLPGMVVEAETTHGTISGQLISMHWDSVVIHDSTGQRVLSPESILQLKPR